MTEKIDVSDHAVVRYLERVCGLNIEEVRNEICTPITEQNILMMGDGRYPIGNQCQVVVKGKVIVTLVTHGLRDDDSGGN